MQAIWNDTVLAESNETVVVDGNHYFPFDSIKEEYFKKQMTSCLDDNILDQNYFTSMPFQKATIPFSLEAASFGSA